MSNTTVVTVRIASSASRSFTSTPARAARSVEIDTTSGIASPSACGQAITSTVITRITACSGWPMRVHASPVSAAAPSANQNSHAAARSASRCALELDACACATSLRIPASVVSSPVAVTSTRNPESVLTVPAVTESPRPRRTVRDSPVTIDSSSSASPSVILPSAGMLPPGRTSTTSPTTRSAGGTFSTASPRTTSAVSGSSAARESSAFVVWARDRISSQWPSSMITISSASSHQNSSEWSSTPRVAPQLARKATVIANPINSIIPGRRARSSLTAPLRNGEPPQA